MQQNLGSRATPVGERSARLLRHLVAGQWRTGEGEEVVDLHPARPHETVARGLLALDGDVDEAVAAAREAFPRAFFTRATTVYLRGSAGAAR